MIKKMLSKKSTIRCIIFAILTFGSYALSILYLFWLHDILWSITFVFLTFIFFHFLFIDIDNVNLRYFILILAGLCIIEIPLFFILKREINIRIILSLLMLNGAIWALFYSLKMINFNSIGYFTRWWYIFTLCISIMYSIAFVGMFQSFPFTCQWLDEASGKLFEFVEKPFVMIKNRNSDKSETQNKLEENVSNLINNINDVDISSSEWSTENPIINKINSFKKDTIDQILADKTEYAEWMCDLLLNEINTILANDGVKRSVILLSYLLLYWFIRIAKVYKLVKKNKIVDELN